MTAEELDKFVASVKKYAEKIATAVTGQERRDAGVELHEALNPPSDEGNGTTETAPAA